MAEETGFTTMAGPVAAGSVPEIGVGMLGYAFRGTAHTNAYKKIPYARSIANTCSARTPSAGPGTK